MSYEVGTHIDLTHLNKKVVAPTRSKKSIEQAAHELYQVGTKFIFWITPEGFQAAKKIDVAFA